VLRPWVRSPHGPGGALPEEGGADAAGDDDAGVSEPPTYAYPDPDAVDASSPTIPVRNRLARTPSRKTRDENAANAMQPLQPTAPRARASVERVQRRQPPQAPPAGGETGHAFGGGSPQAPGSRSVRGGGPPAEPPPAEGGGDGQE